MSMTKQGVVARPNMDVIGASLEKDSYICDHCKKIVQANSQSSNKCPYCGHKQDDVGN